MERLAGWHDEEIKRFLRARQGDVRKATTMLEEHLVWRRDIGADQVWCGVVGWGVMVLGPPTRGAARCSAEHKTHASSVCRCNVGFVEAEAVWGRGDAYRCQQVCMCTTRVGAIALCGTQILSVPFPDATVRAAISPKVYGLHDKEGHPIYYEKFGAWRSRAACSGPWADP